MSCQLALFGSYLHPFTILKGTEHGSQLSSNNPGEQRIIAVMTL